MAEKDLEKREQTEGEPEREHPFYALQKRMNDMFEDFWRGWPTPSFDWPAMPGFGPGKFTPKVNVQDDGKAVHVHAELPGMSEKDVEVTLTDDGLTISGEKKAESEEKGKHFLRREFSYGAFRRLIPLPPGVQADQVKATFKNGVLEVELPLPDAERKKAKKIDVKSS